MNSEEKPRASAKAAWERPRLVRAFRMRAPTTPCMSVCLSTFPKHKLAYRYITTGWRNVNKSLRFALGVSKKRDDIIRISAHASENWDPPKASS